MITELVTEVVPELAKKHGRWAAWAGTVGSVLVLGINAYNEREAQAVQTKNSETRTALLQAQSEQIQALNNAMNDLKEQVGELRGSMGIFTTRSTMPSVSARWSHPTVAPVNAIQTNAVKVAALLEELQKK